MKKHNKTLRQIIRPALYFNLRCNFLSDHPACHLERVWSNSNANRRSDRPRQKLEMFESMRRSAMRDLESAASVSSLDLPFTDMLCRKKRAENRRTAENNRARISPEVSSLVRSCGAFWAHCDVILVQFYDCRTTGWGGHMFRRFCNMFSKSSPCLLGQHGSIAQRPVKLSENSLQNLLGGFFTQKKTYLMT